MPPSSCHIRVPGLHRLLGGTVDVAKVATDHPPNDIASPPCGGECGGSVCPARGRCARLGEWCWQMASSRLGKRRYVLDGCSMDGGCCCCCCCCCRFEGEWYFIPRVFHKEMKDWERLWRFAKQKTKGIKLGGSFNLSWKNIKLVKLDHFPK